MPLAFFNRISATLSIKLTEPAQPVAEGLQNQKAAPSATIQSLELRPSVYENEKFRPLTPKELDRVVLDEPEIRLRSLGEAVTHKAPNGEHFTVRDLLAAVEETERQTRAQSAWFGGIDVHHVFFEGIHPEDGGWRIYWGS
jgi:hypothetical protein